MNRQWTKVFYLLFPFLYLFQGAVVLHYAVDIPFMDEWEALRPAGLPAGFSWSWLIAQHNEHRIFLTKLQTWLLYWVDGWDLRWHQGMNYLLFALIPIALIKVKARVLPKLSLHEYLAVLVFVLSPLLHQNHMWGFQSQFHFALLFILLSSLLIFSESQSLSKLALGSFCILLSMFSFSNGLVAGVGLLGGYSLYKLSEFWQRRSRQSLVQWGIVVVPCIAGLVMWFHGFHRDPNFAWTYPNHWIFWRFFLNLISLGFGANSENVGVASAFALFAFFPLVWAVTNFRKIRNSKAQWLIFSLQVAIIGSLATIALGRAASLMGSKASRYAEFAVTLVPLSYLAWRGILENKSALLVQRFSTVFFVVIAFSFMDDWNILRPYRSHEPPMRRGVACVQDYFEGRNAQGFCPDLYPLPLAERLDRAKELGLSFTRSQKTN